MRFFDSNDGMVPHKGSISAPPAAASPSLELKPKRRAEGNASPPLTGAAGAGPR